MIQSGNYRIVNCQDNIAVIPDLLHKLYDALGPIIEDAELKKASSAYATFFKDIAYSTYVSAVLTNVSTGAAMDAEGGPAFVCVNAPGQFSFTDAATMQKTDTYKVCHDNSDVPIFYIYNNPYIIVCPRFFDPGRLPTPPPDTCQPVSRNGEQFLGHSDLISYQIWFMLHEIVHYYIYATKQSTRDDYDINDCLRLSGKDAVENAQSYAFYAASIYGGCKDFPTPPRRTIGIELLEIDQESTESPPNAIIAVKGSAVAEDAQGSVRF